MLLTPTNPGPYLDTQIFKAPRQPDNFFVVTAIIDGKYNPSGPEVIFQVVGPMSSIRQDCFDACFDIWVDSDLADDADCRPVLADDADIQTVCQLVSNYFNCDSVDFQSYHV